MGLDLVFSWLIPPESERNEKSHFVVALREDDVFLTYVRFTRILNYVIIQSLNMSK